MLQRTPMPSKLRPKEVAWVNLAHTSATGRSAIDADGTVPHAGMICFFLNPRHSAKFREWRLASQRYRVFP